MGGVRTCGGSDCRTFDLHPLLIDFRSTDHATRTPSSKRELIGDGPPSDGVRRSGVHTAGYTDVKIFDTPGIEIRHVTIADSINTPEVSTHTMRR